VLTAVLGIGAAVADRAAGHVFPAPSFSPIVASMIGLGVGVDYALFIVTRFREALHHGQTGERDGDRDEHRGRTVIIAGTTVIIGMLGLLVLRQSRSTGWPSQRRPRSPWCCSARSPASRVARLRHPAGEAVQAPAAPVAGRRPASAASGQPAHRRLPRGGRA